MIINHVNNFNMSSSVLHKMWKLECDVCEQPSSQMLKNISEDFLHFYFFCLQSCLSILCTTNTSKITEIRFDIGWNAKFCEYSSLRNITRCNHMLTYWTQIIFTFMQNKCVKTDFLWSSSIRWCAIRILLSLKLLFNENNDCHRELETEWYWCLHSNPLYFKTYYSQ